MSTTIVNRWEVRSRTDPGFCSLADRHYSRRTPGKGNPIGPVSSIVLVTADEAAAWATTYTLYPRDGLDAWRCSIFRNEGGALSSGLILDAMAVTAELWGSAPNGWLTYVDTAKVRSKRDPGRCFLRAGWWRDETYRPDRRRKTLIRLRADA